MATGTKTNASKKPTLKELDTVNNYMLIKFTYGNTICVPYEDGATIVAAMQKAEKCEQGYNTKLKFLPEAISIDVSTLSQQAYRDAKMRLLLGITDEENPLDDLE